MNFSSEEEALLAVIKILPFYSEILCRSISISLSSTFLKSSGSSVMPALISGMSVGGFCLSIGAIGRISFIFGFFRFHSNDFAAYFVLLNAWSFSKAWLLCIYPAHPSSNSKLIKFLFIIKYQ